MKLKLKMLLKTEHVTKYKKNIEKMKILMKIKVKLKVLNENRRFFNLLQRYEYCYQMVNAISHIFATFVHRLSANQRVES